MSKHCKNVILNPSIFSTKTLVQFYTSTADVARPFSVVNNKEPPFLYGSEIDNPFCRSGQIAPRDECVRRYETRYIPVICLY